MLASPAWTTPTLARNSPARFRPDRAGELDRFDGPAPVGLAFSPPAIVSTAQISLVQIIDTSVFSSPDPAGITYLPSTNTLLIADSEVDEMEIFSNTNTNLFQTTLSGTLVYTANTYSFSIEPSGLTFNPFKQHLFFTDDDEDKVFAVAAGPDNLNGTADDELYSSFDTRAFNSRDPEGIAFDRASGHLFIADGQNAEVYRISPGDDGIFNGLSPTGDDELISSFDTAALGLADPEGIDINPDNGNLNIVGRGTDFIIETTTAGQIVSAIDVSFLPRTLAGLAYAPGSKNPAVMNLYIADRGVDNDRVPEENDGKVYEISPSSISLPTITAFNPITGLVGITVTLSGTNFISTTAVAFNGTPAGSFSIDSDTQLQVNLPSGATTGLISVFNKNGAGFSADSFMVITHTYLPIILR